MKVELLIRLKGDNHELWACIDTDVNNVTIDHCKIVRLLYSKSCSLKKCSQKYIHVVQML